MGKCSHMEATRYNRYWHMRSSDIFMGRIEILSTWLIVRQGSFLSNNRVEMSESAGIATDFALCFLVVVVHEISPCGCYWIVEFCLSAVCNWAVIVPCGFGM